MARPRSFSPLPFLGLVAFLAQGTHSTAALRDLCPATCVESGPEPSNWTVVAEVGQLQACARPLLLDFSLTIPVTSKQHIRTCNVWANDFNHIAAHGVDTGSSPLRSNSAAEDVVPELAWTPAASDNEAGGRLASQSVEHLRNYLASGFQAANQTSLFATVSGTTAGVYVGADVLSPSAAEKLFGPFLSSLYTAGIADSKATIIQVCKGRTRESIFGLVAAASADFALVHEAVSRWSNGSCVDTSSYGETRELDTVTIATVKPALAPVGSNSTVGNATRTVRGLLHARADGDCRTETVIPDDRCGKIIARCGNGLKDADFYKYNPGDNFCNVLKEGQLVCCTPGKLPRPKKNADGSCFAYQIKQNDNCEKVALGHGLTVDELNKFNKDTWGTY